MSDTNSESNETPAVLRPEIPRTELSQGFWDAIEKGSLAFQRCTACERLRHYPQPLCPECHSGESDWQTVDGLGRIYSYTVAHRAFHPAWRDHVPYVIATIELDCGVRMVCDLLDVDPDTIEIDQRVKARFQELPGQGVMPRFEVID